MKQKTFYVYFHRKKSDNSIFYVGKGSAKRANRTQGRSQYWRRIVDKHGFYVEIVAGFTEETLSFELESFLISEIGRDNLCNLTDGGEGCSGRVMPDAQRQKASRMLKGKVPLEAVEASKFYNSKPIGTVCGLRFDSLVSAANWIASNKVSTACRAGIHASASGKSRLAYGYEWRYVLPCGALSESKYKKSDYSWCRPVKSSLGNFDSAKAAQDYLRTIGFTKALASNIIQSCRRENMKAYGFKWIYQELDS